MEKDAQRIADEAEQEAEATSGKERRPSPERKPLFHFEEKPRGMRKGRVLH